MTVTLATKTVQAINNKIKEDQGKSFRGWLRAVILHIGDAYRTDDDGFRSHLGASLLGRECARELWYKFHWTTESKFDGRMLRLFNRGHLEEARFVAMLLMIGCNVYQQDVNGKQYRISFADGHAGGSGDGVAIDIPDLPPGTPAVTEFKTHNDKSFQKLKASGVKVAKFEHYVQMQLYMRKMGLAVALYLAVNKNDDELYGEIITLDIELADQFVARGETIVWMKQPPERISNTPGFFKCRYCDEQPVCQLKAQPARNCRTCLFAAPAPNAEWHCSNPVCPGPVTKEIQLTGCSHYEMNEVYR